MYRRRKKRKKKEFKKQNSSLMYGRYLKVSFSTGKINQVFGFPVQKVSLIFFRRNIQTTGEGHFSRDVSAVCRAPLRLQHCGLWPPTVVQQQHCTTFSSSGSEGRCRPVVHEHVHRSESRQRSCRVQTHETGNHETVNHVEGQLQSVGCRYRPGPTGFPRAARNLGVFAVS